MKYYLFQQDDDEAYKQKISVANNFLTLIGDDDDAAWLTWQQGKNLLSYMMVFLHFFWGKKEDVADDASVSI